MPARWKGDAHDRYAELDKTGRRCDGNKRLCVRAAVQMIWVLRPADSMNPFATPQEKITCNFHRREFENSEFWKLIRTHRMPPRYTTEELRDMPRWWENTGTDAQHAA